MSQPIVLKIGGHDVADDAFLRELATTIASLSQACIIVHGGGKEISALQTQLGITPRYIDGVRITDEASLSVVQMVLAGIVNKRLVRYLNHASCDAIGLTGVDRQMIIARPMPHPTLDMGFTGEIVAVKYLVLEHFLPSIIPVIAPLCYGEDGHIYNVNADHVAGAVAAAMDVERLVFLTNVPGVLYDDALIPYLTPSQAEQLITDGMITGGMIPKVRTALQALHHGAKQVTITNLTGFQHRQGTTLTLDA